MSNRSNTFVLIHGAWHGGWVWRDIATILQAHGHKVNPVTLTGLGERAHLLTPDVGLSTHIEDVARHIEMEELKDVIAVGWSYGGMVLTGLLSRVADLIGTAVYLDAFLPEDGKSVYDYATAEQAAIKKAQIDGQIVRPLPDNAYQERWGVTDKAVIEAAAVRCTPQPLKSFTEPVHAPMGLPADIKYIYVKLAGDQPTPFKNCYEQALTDPRFTTYKFEDPHPMMLTNPGDLAELLLGIQ